MSLSVFLRIHMFLHGDSVSVFISSVANQAHFRPARLIRSPVTCCTQGRGGRGCFYGVRWWIVVIVIRMLSVMNVLLTLFVITPCRPDATPPKAPSLLVKRRHVGPAAAVMYEAARRRALVKKNQWRRMCVGKTGFNEATCSKLLGFFYFVFLITY